MGVAILEQRAPNFAERKQWRCLNCGKSIEAPTDLYSRRFCSAECREDYFNNAKLR